MNILKAAEAYVFDLFQNNEQGTMPYHNYEHTADVVDAAGEIARGSGLSDDDVEIVLLAAWFHDTGYVHVYDGHEEESTKIATDFLNAQHYDELKTETIQSAIRATRYPPQPNTLLEKVLCDADLSHIGKKGYLKRLQALHLEWELVGKAVEESDWAEQEIKFLRSHTFYTEYASVKYLERKKKNIDRLKEIQSDAMKPTKKEKIKKEKNKDDSPQRGIETLFRVAFRNHMDLSAIADNKANIMLSINAIIISISLSVLVPKFEATPLLIFPTSILIMACVGSIVFATLSTRPKITTGKFKRKDVENKTSNILFFGNFHSMSLEEFEWGMGEMMKSGPFLYGSMMRDIYSLGKVLAGKYKYLRITYNFFMFGMILAVISFLFTFLFIG